MLKFENLLEELRNEISGGKITFSIEGEVGTGKIKTIYNTLKNKLTYKDKIKKIVR